jgi:predicted 3-demethylubiquinone-9 3-methyltransferase (glyoxalase superfamily)
MIVDGLRHFRAYGKMAIHPTGRCPVLIYFGLSAHCGSRKIIIRLRTNIPPQLGQTQPLGWLKHKTGVTFNITPALCLT